MKVWMTAGLVLAMSCMAMAAETAAEPTAMPTVPVDTIWAGVMVRIIIGLFIAAAAIGPLVAILMPPAPELVVAHDDHGHGHDDHGHADHGHGGHGH